MSISCKIRIRCFSSCIKKVFLTINLSIRRYVIFFNIFKKVYIYLLVRIVI